MLRSLVRRGLQSSVCKRAAVRPQPWASSAYNCCVADGTMFLQECVVVCLSNTQINCCVRVRGRGSMSLTEDLPNGDASCCGAEDAAREEAAPAQSHSAGAPAAGIALPMGAAALGLDEADLSCPICMSLLRDPFAMPCGHTFCFGCVTQHLAARNSCPACAAYLTRDRIFPNFLLNKARRAPAAGSNALNVTALVAGVRDGVHLPALHAACGPSLC